MVPSDFPSFSAEGKILEEDLISSVVSVSSNPTKEHPAIIQLGLQNQSENILEFEFGFTYPFDSVRNNEGPATVFLVPLDGAESMLESGIPETLTDGCWKFDGELVLPQSGMNIQLDSGESVMRKYALLMPPYSDLCFPSGTYLYTTEFVMSSDSEGQKSVSWELTVQIHD